MAAGNTLKHPFLNKCFKACNVSVERLTHETQLNLKYMYLDSVVGVCCLTPLSTIFQLYRGGQFYW